MNTKTLTALLVILALWGCGSAEPAQEASQQPSLSVVEPLESGVSHSELGIEPVAQSSEDTWQSAMQLYQERCHSCHMLIGPAQSQRMQADLGALDPNMNMMILSALELELLTHYLVAVEQGQASIPD